MYRLEGLAIVLQLCNRTPFKSTILVLPDASGVDTLYVVVRATFAVKSGSNLEVAAEQQPIALADEYDGEPGASSLKLASEAHLGKPGTDVAIVGEACAPGGNPVAVVDVGVSVASRTQYARVYGDRFWDVGMAGLKPSSPKAFVRMPLLYERTFGGSHPESPGSDQLVADARNPVGCGFRGKRKDKELLGQPVPNIQNANRPVDKPSNNGDPVGFGPVAPNWMPRLQYAGTYDETWKKSRAPYLPNDFDQRFFQSASPFWVFPQSLQGGEPVATLNLSPEGRLRFNLPRCALAVRVTFDNREEQPEAELETVLLAPTEGYLCMTWRAAARCDKEALGVKEVNIEASAMELGMVMS